MPTYVTEWYLLPQSDARTLRAIERPAAVYLSFGVFILLYLLLAYILHATEANRFSASQQIPRILWNLKFHYYIYKYPPPVPLRSLTLLPKGGKVNFRNRHLL
jgi:hypothetical protein